MTDKREFGPFDPDIPDGLQVEMYDDTPAPPDEVLRALVDSGNELWARLFPIKLDASTTDEVGALLSRPLPADSTEPQ